MTRWLVLPVIWLAVSAGAVLAQEYRVEKFDNVPCPRKFRRTLPASFPPAGFKVMQGENRTLYEFWPANEWATKPGFSPSATIIDPVQPGVLVGVVRLKRKGADFRGQDIASGVYTLRYANQPEDGNHVGTFATRDFLLMVPAAADTSPDVIDRNGPVREERRECRLDASGDHAVGEGRGGGDLPSMQHSGRTRVVGGALRRQRARRQAAALGLIVVGKAAE